MSDERQDPTDECECEHLREDHADGVGVCNEPASSGYVCACPWFREASR